MRFKNAFAAAIAVAVSAVVFSAAFQPAEAATTTYTGPFSTPATITAGDTALLNNGATVTGTGVITTNGTLQVDQTATTLTFGNTIAGTGTFSLTNSGTVNLTGTSRALDLTTSVSAGRLTTGGTLTIGNTGTGTLNVSGGLVTSGTLTIGQSGTGTLSVSGGGVTSTRGDIGKGAGSVGSATVSSGTWAVSDYLIVGGAGTGTLKVNGGSVTGASQFVLGTVGVGTATVESGTFTNRSILVGDNGGTGTLNVNGSGRVNTTTDAYVGYSSVGTGTVSSGTWAITRELHVGWAAPGTGTLNVTGGYVSCQDAYIGKYGVGSVTVESGTLAISNRIDVGSSGTGTLTINGGLVSVDGPFFRNSSGTATGTVNLNSGGTLQLGGGLYTNLMNNGTLIYAPLSSLAYSGVISGTGAVRKQGTETLELKGTNSYTGPTNVDAGALLVNGLLGNTAVTVNAGGLLGGSGTIPGSVAVAASGTIFPGYNDDSFFYPVTLTVGSLSLVTDSHTVMLIDEINVGNYDKLVGTGTGGLTYGGNLDLLLTGSYADGTTWNLFSDFLTKTGDFADVVVTAPGDEYDGLTFTNAGGVWTSTMTANNQYLEFTQSTGNLVVVPEPSTIAMTLAGLACGGWQVVRRGRRLRQAASLSA